MRRSRYKMRVKDLVDAVRTGEPCYYCGENAPEVKDFHHREGEVKLFHVGNSWHHHGLESVAAEIAKCRIVCANCHRKIHAGTLGENSERKPA